MKLRFKVQPHQTNAVNSVVDCFAGQPMIAGPTHRIDPGIAGIGRRIRIEAEYEGSKNADMALTEERILKNVREVQRRQNLPVSRSLTNFTTFDNKGGRVPVKAAYREGVLAAAPVHLDVEMETGTGKTYCYIKSIFEMNRRYGWSKFVVMTPSIAIREGVCKSLEITADHFAEDYGKKARFFIYNSKRLHELESFSSDSGINVMVINIQAFSSIRAENRRIYEELDDFQSRRPIDVIASNRPILILDEPQKMEGKATMEALPKFKPLFVLRYSATHRTQHNRVHRLDALDAYNRKLVKRIAVRGIETRGVAGTDSYLYLEGIETSKNVPVARVEMEVKLRSGEIGRRLRRLKFRDNLFELSGGLNQYRGFTISQIDAVNDTVEFTNGVVLRAGEANGDVSERDIRRIQIRETIKAHMEKERQLFGQGIKVLSLFFIDEVVKYRDYDQVDEKGEYARIFEEAYESLKKEYLSELAIDNEDYFRHLAGIETSKTHNGYFSVDKKTNRMKDPVVGKRAVDSDDVDAYDLILKDKERLLSFEEPTRFIFSHSALREGWDNPNIFVMCMLKHGDNTISRRQEVGRGLRLSVDKNGDRMDNLAVVHDINVLTVVANESYKDFVAGLQGEIAETLSARPRRATEAYFTGKTLATEQGPVEVTAAMAKRIYLYLANNAYTDDANHVTAAYHEARTAGTLADLPEGLQPYAEQVLALIDGVFSDAQLPEVADGRKSKVNPLNANFKKKEFQELWARINRKAVYRVEFDSTELVQKCIGELNDRLRVAPLRYNIEIGEQNDALTGDRIRAGGGFAVTGTRIETPTDIRVERGRSIPSPAKYDLVGDVAGASRLTRDTAAAILGGIEPAVFGQFKKNPENFISEASRIIAEQKATMMVERLTYDEIGEKYDVDIFTANQAGRDFSRATKKLKKHIYDHAITDSSVEKDFVEALDAGSEVVVYAKLPRGFLIPTPVGDYNPDWAISFKVGDMRHVYFVAETKGTMSSMRLRGIEDVKVKCGEKFFDGIGRGVAGDRVKYGVVTDYGGLMDLIRNPA